MRVRLFITCCLAACLAPSAFAEPWDDDTLVKNCNSGLENPNFAVDACTIAIQSGKWAGKATEWAYIGRGFAFSIAGSYARAIEDLDHAIALEPEHAHTHFLRGLAYSSLELHQRALADFDRAITLKPDYGDAYVGRGYSYYSLSKLRQAIRDYDRAVALDPSDAYAYMNRAYARFSLGYEQSALSDARHAITLASKKADLTDSLGDLLCKSGQIEAATQAWAEARTLDETMTQRKQIQLRALKLYQGDLGGGFSPALDQALQAWAKAGCPAA